MAETGAVKLALQGSTGKSRWSFAFLVIVIAKSADQQRLKSSSPSKKTVGKVDSKRGEMPSKSERKSPKNIPDDRIRFVPERECGL